MWLRSSCSYSSSTFMDWDLCLKEFYFVLVLCRRLWKLLFFGQFDRRSSLQSRRPRMSAISGNTGRGAVFVALGVSSVIESVHQDSSPKVKTSVDVDGFYGQLLLNEPSFSANFSFWLCGQFHQSGKGWIFWVITAFNVSRRHFSVESQGSEDIFSGNIRISQVAHFSVSMFCSEFFSTVSYLAC